MRGVLFFFAILALGGAAEALAQDVSGSKDHPAVTRYPGSEIRWYDEQAFEPYAIATGPVTGYRQIDDWIDVEGRTTRIYYELEGAKTHTEVYANYRKALRDDGFELLVENVFPRSSQANEAGSRKWLGVQYARNEIPPAGIRLLQGSSTGGGSGFLAARKARAEGTLYVAIGVTQYAQDVVTALIDVIEVDDVETGLVTVDAGAMGDEIDEYGRVTLHGLHFDHDRATLTAASRPALEEIARFLDSRPEMAFYVVGHTDATGSFDYNARLSEQRAAAVVAELVNAHGIEASRLEPHGVGPLAPVLSNASDEGRAKNRRVELVERR